MLTGEVSHAAQEVMKGVVTSGTGTAAQMYNGQPVAGKTGTSEDYKDISFVGMTPFTAAAIWVGDPTNEQSVPADSCADVFRNYTASIMSDEGIEVQDFPGAEDPPYEWYEDQEHQVYSSGTYGAIHEAEERAAREAEAQRRAQEKKDNDRKR